MRLTTGLLLVVLLLFAGSCDGGKEDANGRAEVVAVSDTIASAERPVFYVRDPGDAHRLMAYDWTGERRGDVRVSASEPFGAYPSPDGTMMLLTHGHVLSGGEAVGSVAPGMWAADGTHVCTFLNEHGAPGAFEERKVSDNRYEGRSVGASLFVQTTTGDMQRVVDYGSFGPHGGPEVLACNVLADRAVIVERFVGQPSEPSVVRLTDGQILYEGLPSESEPLLDIVSSQDGSLLAEGATASLFGNSFLVRAVPAGNVVSRVSGGGAVAFSGDNSRVLTVQYLNGGNEFGEYQVIELDTGRVVWSAVLSPGTIVTRPYSGDLLVASRSWEPSKTRENVNDAFEDMWLIPADGPARMLLQHVMPLQ